MALCGASNREAAAFDMASHPRTYNIPGHAHELTFSCNGRYPFLKSDRTCGWLREAITEAKNKHSFDLWAYVFMPEHVHLIVFPRESAYSIEAIRKSIKEPVGRRAIAFLREIESPWLARLAISKRDRTRYRFWQQGKGYDRNITEPTRLLSMIDYIHLNPVRRGLVSRAQDWEWSSATQFIHGAVSKLPIDQIPPSWLDQV